MSDFGNDFGEVIGNVIKAMIGEISYLEVKMWCFVGCIDLN